MKNTKNQVKETQKQVNETKNQGNNPINEANEQAPKTENLEKLRELRIQEKEIKARILEVKDLAIKEAREQVTKGKFISPEGHTYILEREDTYDMVGKPQKYTMPEAVIYRRKNSEQVELKKQSSVLTKDMKAIKEAFPIAHPNILPDEVTYNVKCLD